MIQNLSWTVFVDKAVSSSLNYSKQNDHFLILCDMKLNKGEFSVLLEMLLWWILTMGLTMVDFVHRGYP